MTRLFLLSTTACLAPVVALSSSAHADTADPAEVLLDIDPNQPIVILADTYEQSDELREYVGEAFPASEGWLVNWEMIVDSDPSVQASIIGTVVVDNLSNAPRDFEVILDAPICPSVQNQTLMGALVELNLKTDIGGGAMTLDVPGEAVWSALADGAVAKTLWYSPFLLSVSGAGMAETSISFGAPFPNEVGPEVHLSTGIKIQFNLTPGETVTMTTYYFLAGEDENLGECAPELLGDVNQDTVVDTMDLLVLLSQWGECMHCDGDLNGDSTVDTDDLLIILTQFGQTL